MTTFLCFRHIRSRSLRGFLFIAMICASVATGIASAQTTLLPRHPLPAPELLFIENRGQLAEKSGKPLPEVRYYTAAAGSQTYLTANSLHYVFTKLHGGKSLTETAHSSTSTAQRPLADNYDSVTLYRLDMRFIGANPQPVILADKKAECYFNYYLPQCPDGLTFVPGYRRLLYKDLYPAIDMAVYISGTGMKYDFIVRPGGDISQIKMEYDGQTSLTQTAKRGLEITSPFGSVTEDAPYSFVEQGGQQTTVESEFIVKGSTVSFRTGKYDHTKTLIIDPTRMWGTYYGDNDLDYCSSVAVDGANNIVVGGWTYSGVGIATIGSHQNGSAGGTDGFVVKFDQSGNRLWATYYGGSSHERTKGIAVDKSNNIIFAGSTQSTTSIATAGAYQSTNGGQWDDFIVKFNAAGVRQWGTYYGGAGNEGYGGPEENHVAVDKDDNILFAEHSLVKFTPAGGYLWSAYFGGGQEIYSVAADSENNIFIVGETDAPSGIATPGSYQSVLAGMEDAYIAKYDANGTLLWATYYGGTLQDSFLDAAVDGTDNLLIVGHSGSSNGIATAGTHQTVMNGAFDVIVVKFTGNGARVWGTYYGGGNADEALALALNSAGDIYVAGNTRSATNIATPDGWQTSLAGVSNALLAKFRTSNGTLSWGTYYGGAGDDGGACDAVDRFDNPILIGTTTSTTNIASPGAFKTSYFAQRDGFIVKFCDVTPSVSNVTGSAVICKGTSAELAAQVGFNSYQWYRNGSPIAGATARIHITDNTLPPGVYKYWTAATASGGCSGVSDTIIVTVADNPQVDAGRDTTLCSGSFAVIGSVPTRGTPPYRYQWTPRIGLNDSAIVQPTASPAVTTKYKLLVTDANGCTGEDSVTITVRPAPVLRVANREILLCKGADTTIAVVVVNGTPPFTYTWQPPLALASPTSASTLASPTQSIRYTITVSDINGCKAIDSVTIIVNDPPAPKIMVAGSRTFCKDDSAQLSTEQQYAAYRWSDGSTSSSITVRQPGKYFVTVTDGNGCTGRSDTIEIKQGAMPPGIILGPNTSCPGAITSYLAAKGGAFKWTLSGGGTILNGQTGDSIAIQWITNGVWILSLRQTSVDGCVKDTTLKITIDNKLSPKITVSGATIFCKGDSVVLSAPGYASYRWSNGATTPSITVTSSGKYHVTVANNGGCAGVSDTVNITVSDLPKPAPDIKSSDSVICDGETITLESSQDYAGYQWSTGAITKGITVMQGGRYILTVTNSDGCMGRDTIIIRAGAKPDVTVTVMGAAVLCQGDSVELRASGGFTGYRWSNGAVTPVIYVRKSGSYTVTVTNSDGCEGTSQPVTITVNPAPAPVINGAVRVCLNTTGDYSVTGISGTIIQWNVAGGVILSGQTSASLSILWNVVGTGTITVLQRDTITGCAGTAMLTVIIDSTLKPVIRDVPPFLCEGMSAVLRTDKGYTTYQWFKDNAAISGATTDTLIISQAGVYSVSVVGTGNCAGISDKVTVIVYPLPPKPVIFQNDTILYTTTVAATYQWYMNGTPIPGATNDTLIITGTAGDYTLRITDANGCSSISDPYTPGSTAVMTVAFPFMSGKAGDNVRIPLLLKNYQGISTTGRTFVARVHFNETLLVPTGATPIGTAQNGERHLTLTGTTSLPIDTLMIMNCIATLGADTCTALVIDSFEWQNFDATVFKENGQFCIEEICYANGAPRLLKTTAKTAIAAVYPNPVSAMLTVEYGIAENGRTRITLSDPIGRKVRDIADYIAKAGTYSITANLDDLAQGLYFLTLETPSETVHTQLRIIH